jgi:hypothetical protein
VQAPPHRAETAQEELALPGHKRPEYLIYQSLQTYVPPMCWKAHPSQRVCWLILPDNLLSIENTRLYIQYVESNRPKQVDEQISFVNLAFLMTDAISDS